MNKRFQLYLILLFTLISQIVQAQFKLGVSGGNNRILNSQNDTISFAKANGTAFGFKPSYAWGRVAFTGNIQISNNNVDPEGSESNRLALDTPTRTLTISGVSGLSTTMLTFGPEICFCYNKLRIVPSLKYGVTITKIKGSRKTFQGSQGFQGRFYEVFDQTINSPTLQTGVTVGYKITCNISVSLTTDFSTYKDQFTVIDNRRPLPTIPDGVRREVTQSYKTLTTQVGLTYHF